MNIYKKQNGSALIIALLIMGILMTLALGLSNLVIREVRITSDIINAGKAYYAAESGVESALLDLHQNLPGYETQDGMYKGIKEGGDLKEDLTFEYSINNKSHTYPFVDTEIISKEIAQDAPKKYQYNELGLSDSVSIPLFNAKDDGSVEQITNFRVEFFIDAEISTKYSQAVTKKYIDMLRWKITGISKNSPGKRDFYTESIGDYMPVFEGSSSTMPTCLGTGDSNIEFTDPESGIFYSANCNELIWKWARESYVLEWDGEAGAYTTQSRVWDPKGENDDAVRISDFLGNHQTVYLTLTNIFNPEVLRGRPGITKEDQAKIYYRIIVPDQKIVREFAKIKSTGSYGKLRQQVEAFIRPDSFLPVFNFSLYRTDTTDDRETVTGFGPSSS
jgi:type II secretory pathway pseudopilin PulG